MNSADQEYDMYATTPDSTRIHPFRVKEKFFVLDVNSCVFFEIDNIIFDLFAHLQAGLSETEAIERACVYFTREDVLEALAAIRDLQQSGQLYSEENEYEVPRNRPTLSTICLNVSHKCNLKCRYCFANGGDYGHSEILMTPEVAKNAIDLLLHESGRQEKLSVSFFGGEPLLNFRVIEETVDYASDKGARCGKSFRFHITTNGLLLSEKKLDFIEKNNISMIVSLDGPKDVHDSMRRFANGVGSYDLVLKNLRRLANRGRRVTVRSTFTPFNTEIDQLAVHLAQLGFEDISVEPCVTDDEELRWNAADVLRLKERYSALAEIYIDMSEFKTRFSLFHFRQAIEQAKKRKIRLTQCGAANGYVAVGADGGIYPCHKFVGRDEFLMGNVGTGFSSTGLAEDFRAANVRNKPSCMSCWARYACGGGCHSHAVMFNHDIREPYGVECELMRHRIELGAYMHSMGCPTRS